MTNKIVDKIIKEAKQTINYSNGVKGYIIDLDLNLIEDLSKCIPLYQRDISKTHIKYLVDQQLNNWKEHLVANNAFVLRVDGEKVFLEDGQHRILAALQTKFEFMNAVVIITPFTDDYNYIDEIRTRGGRVKLKHYVISNNITDKKISASVKAAIKMRHNKGQQGSKQRNTRKEAEMIGSDPYLLDLLEVKLPKGQGQSIPAGFLGAFRWTMEIDKNTAIKFFEGFRDNNHIIDGVFCPSLRLLCNWYNENRARGQKWNNHDISRETFFMYIRAWNDFRLGETPNQKYKYHGTKSKIPEPV